MPKNTSSRKMGVLRGADLDIYPGEIVGLTGKSGCGKTTLGRILAGILPPDEGQIYYQGQLLAAPADWRRVRGGIQMVFQDSYQSLNPALTVGQILADPLRAGRIVRREEEAVHVEEMLERVRLPRQTAKKYPGELSGGQRQRVGIARALMTKPEFLVCDEIISALDVTIQVQILNLLKQLQEEEQMACLFISHQLAAVEWISDRVLCMENGKLEERI